MNENKMALFALPLILVLSEPAFEKNCHAHDAGLPDSLPTTYRESSCDTLATNALPHNHFELNPEFPSTASPISASGAQHYAYQLEFECPKCAEKIGHLCDSPSEVLSKAQAKIVFANEEVWCNCGWHGKAGQLELTRIYRNGWF
jgi:hypothetical protein